MKPFLILAALLPAAVLANAIREAAPASPGPVKASASATVTKTAKERWQTAAKADEASFRRHVIPLMSRAGCSGRECHGSFQGRGGFQLSLFGYDFEKDHEAITKGKGGAEEIRVDLNDPVKSLVLAKPSLDGEEHKGKKRFDKGSWEYNLILKWIQSGAKSDVAETGEFARLDVSPKELVFKKSGEAIQLKVVAHWKDGTVEDVTQLTRFRTNDESVALVSDTGLVTAKTPGDTHIVAFYDNGVEPVPAVLPVSDRVGAKFPAVKTRTKVDELVIAKLRKTGILPSEICTDLEFLRRASLDVTGTLPTPKEIEAFAKDTAPDKRARKVDELLARPSYAAWWTTKLCDFTGNNPRLIRMNGNGRNLNGEMSKQWYSWIYKRIADNTPYDQLAAGIVLAVSRTAPDQKYADFVNEMGSYFRKDQPADFAHRSNLPWYWMRQNVQKPEEKALAFAHTFLGVRIECAQCHKHPFDQWTKQDFEHFQAFFSGVAYGGGNGGKGKMAKGEEAAGATAEMTPASLRQEIKEKVEASMAGKPVDPKKNEKQKYEQTEVSRRIAAGEPIPWDELVVDIKRVGQPMKQDKKEVKGSSRVITPKILGGGEVAMDAIQRSARAADGMAARQGEPVFCEGIREPRVGLVFQPRHRGAGGRPEPRECPEQCRAFRLPRGWFCGAQFRHEVAAQGDPEQRHVSAELEDESDQQAGREKFQPRRHPPPAGRSRFRRHRDGHGLDGACGEISDRDHRAVHRAECDVRQRQGRRRQLCAEHFRQARARDQLRLRAHDRSHPAPDHLHAERSHRCFSVWMETKGRVGWTKCGANSRRMASAVPKRSGRNWPSFRRARGRPPSF